MKEKAVTKIALILLVLVCVFAIVACSDNVNTDGNVCQHVFTEKVDATYLKSAATCTEKAVYYIRTIPTAAVACIALFVPQLLPAAIPLFA